MIINHESLHLSPARYLAWKIRVKDAPNLPDDQFLLWWKAVQNDPHKHATAAEWNAIDRRLTAIARRQLTGQEP